MQTSFDYGFVSADSHVTEPPDCYQRFIDPAYRDRAPFIRRDEKRGDLYVIPGQDNMTVPMGLVAAAGEESSQMTFNGRDFEDWHRDYRHACMVAYNRWLQEYCSFAPDRLFGAGQAAVKNAADAVQELAEIKKMGFKGVMMSGQPGEKDYDDPSYDRLWAAAVDMELPLCFHILTNRAYGGHRGPKINALLNVVRSCQDILGMLIYSGVFDRYPELKVVCVESDAGWAPHYAYRMDHIYNRHRFWNKAPELKKLPSEYFFENIWLTFQDDWTAFQVKDHLNIERIMWANDFPHSDSTWPLSQELLTEHAANLSPHEARRILRDNCVELFGLDVPEQPAALS
jgi:predicted TIM-barrel fold metal-dependent hydrolase